jgi:small-conductance mechanosensitive channel
VVYGLPLEKLKTIPLIIKSIIDGIEYARFERVHFHRFGDFSIDYEVVFYVDSPDYALYMDILQQVNLSIYEKFTEQEIDFAIPPQNVLFNKQDNAKG